MKKQLIIISLFLAIFTAYAQEESTTTTTEATKKERVKKERVKKEKEVKDYCPHQFNLHVGGAFTNNIYTKTPEVQRIYAMGYQFDIGYAYFFHKVVGIGIGIGMEDLSSKIKSNLKGIVPELNFTNPKDLTYDLLYSTNELVEKQNMYAIYVPLTLQFQHKCKGGKNGIYGAIGVQGYFPLFAKSAMKKGELITRGYEEYANVLYQDMEQHGFGSYKFNGTNKLYNKTKEDLRASIDIVADFGGIFEINNKTDFYVGAFVSYGFLDILAKEEFHHTYVNVAATEGKVDYYGLLGSNYLENYNNANNTTYKTAFNLLQVGVKVGVHINACGKVNKTLRKQFYQEMIDRAGTPITAQATTPKKVDEATQTTPQQQEQTQQPQTQQTYPEAQPQTQPQVQPQTIEIIYIIPQYSLPGEEPKSPFISSPVLGKQTNKENANLRELVDILSITKILFDLDKDDPKVAKKDEDNINKVAQILKDDPSLILIVEGYTCDLGSKEHNMALGKRRANNTRDYFISKGVPVDQIETYSYTADQDSSIENIKSNLREEHRAAIFRIKRKQ